MSKNPDYQTVKILLCQKIDQINKQGGTLQSTTTLSSALNQICKEYGGKRDDNEKVLLRAWNDLYRNGDIIPGTSISELSPSFFQVTDKGNESFEYLNRDPGNPQGYLEHLSKKAKIDHIAESYLREALQSYNANCFKAAAVMLGCASERLILNLAEILVGKIKGKGDKPSKKLGSWQIGQIIDGIEHELNQKEKVFPDQLGKRYKKYWPSFVQAIRDVRNKAGHPTDIESIGKPDVHSTLLIFIYFVELNKELEKWVLNKW
jgi:hypothetical protein